MNGHSLRPAVFLDRDGVLNEERSYISRPEQLRLIEGAGQAVRQLNWAGFPVIVVTNQSVVARGGCSKADLEEIHARLIALLAEHSATLDGIYYCPHHPEPGLRAVAEFAVACACRKPQTGMVDRAASEHAIDVSRSWMVGDMVSDVELARRAGMRSILVHGDTAEGLEKLAKAGADFAAPDLAQAVSIVVDHARRD